MGRKELLKSTGKKELTAGKKGTPKKSVKAAGPEKKDPKQEAKATPEAAPAKKATPQPKSKAKEEKVAVAKPKPKAKPKEEKVAAPKKVKVSIKDLIFKKFETAYATEVVAERASDKKAAVKIPDAPPFVTGYDEKETKRIRALLFKGFDLKAEPVVEKPAATPPPGAEALPKYEPPAPVVSGRGGEPMSNGMRLSLCALAGLIVIVIGASFLNSEKYHLKSVDGAVEVWRGKFSPIGTELIISLDGMEAPGVIQDVYSKKAINPMVFGYFQDKANAFLDEPDGPDFARIKGCLHEATSYASTKELGNMVQHRLKGIDFIVFYHKASIALSRGTLPELKAAKTYLDRAGLNATSDYERELLDKIRAAADTAIAALPAE